VYYVSPSLYLPYLRCRHYLPALHATRLFAGSWMAGSGRRWTLYRATGVVSRMSYGSVDVDGLRLLSPLALLPASGIPTISRVGPGRTAVLPAFGGRRCVPTFFQVRGCAVCLYPQRAARSHFYKQTFYLLYALYFHYTSRLLYGLRLFCSAAACAACWQSMFPIAAEGGHPAALPVIHERLTRSLHSGVPDGDGYISNGDVMPNGARYGLSRLQTFFRHIFFVVIQSVLRWRAGRTVCGFTIVTTGIPTLYAAAARCVCRDGGRRGALPDTAQYLLRLGTSDCWTAAYAALYAAWTTPVHYGSVSQRL